VGVVGGGGGARQGLACAGVHTNPTAAGFSPDGKLARKAARSVEKCLMLCIFRLLCGPLVPAPEVP
jgi:hypothetical protein